MRRSVASRLAGTAPLPHLWTMNGADRTAAPGRNPTVRRCLFLIGCALILITPIVGPLPGPGGTIVFALGLGLVLKNSAWAKRCYVRFKQRYPKWGRWSDWGLRRPSARRRAAAAQQDAVQPD